MKKIKKIKVLYFSPTGRTRSVAEFIGKTFSGKMGVPYEMISYTLPHERLNSYFFDEHILLIWVTCVYAGRIPNKTLDFVKTAIKGQNCPAVAAVVFGNRNYDDALKELADIMQENGFRPIAGAALASQHAFSAAVGTGRPDEADFKEIEHFCRYVAECIINKKDMDVLIQPCNEEKSVQYYVPKKEDGAPAKFLKAVPKVIMPENDIRKEVTPDMAYIEGSPVKICKEKAPDVAGECMGCGLCAQVCPMGTIQMQDMHPVFTGTCIKCQACIQSCPVHALYFDDADFLSHVKMLEQNFTKRQDNLFFL